MDFHLFGSIIAELHEPEIIRLNYSGESVHYPHLVEACELAASTGARVELVTALAALPESKLEGLVRSGLSRLTVSLHTLDAAQYQEIYRFGTLGDLTSRIEALLSLRKQFAAKLQIDFAFVAMQRNLNQLQTVVAYAQSLGIRQVCVHPVIRRDPIAEPFAEELADGKLRPGFLRQLRQRIETIKQLHSGVALEFSTPELSECEKSGDKLTHLPAPLPSGWRIFSCDQDPWKTTHILSDGKVVSCEVRDQVVLGDLTQQTLQEIWRGNNYRAFRQDYVDASDSRCRNCVYKIAHFPATPPRSIVPGVAGNTGLLRGWFEPETNIVWGGASAILQMNANAGDRLHLRVMLPAADAEPLFLRARCETQSVEIVHRQSQQRVYDLHLKLESAGVLLCELNVNNCFRPSDDSQSTDQRLLGMALLKAWTAP